MTQVTSQLRLDIFRLTTDEFEEDAIKEDTYLIQGICVSGDFNYCPIFVGENSVIMPFKSCGCLGQ
ncbi:MAG: hypothetical protein HNEKOMLI_00743 [Sodalis sp. Psp]|nr:hypothetical protein [Sodalis sp. Psp]MCR3757280.1 hypothetical protein [Sodalis sp. Ppy]